MFLSIGTGLASIQADSNPAITAAAVLASGSNIALSQSGNQITIAATGELSQTLTNAHIFVGNASNVATDVAMSGAIAITNAGVTSIVAGTITDSMVNAAAAIAFSKMTALTISRALVSDGSGIVSASSVTSTELGYVSGVTSAIQTQINGKITNHPVLNKLVNGDFQIDQRNAGAAASSAGGNNAYGPDMWFVFNRNKTGVFSLQRKTDTPPAGASTYGRVTITTPDASPAHDCEYVLSTRIEGYNISDLSLGTANAQNFTVSFWVRSSLTGTFGGAVESSASDAWVFQYTIAAANTWTYVTTTVTGDTAGTWNNTLNTLGMKLIFDLGSGTDFQASSTSTWSTATEFNHISGNTKLTATNGATLDFALVQIETGSTATSFQARQFATEIKNCERYYEKSYAIGTVPGANTGNGSAAMIASVVGVQLASTETDYFMRFKTTKYNVPTMTFYTPAGVSGSVNCFNSSGVATARSVVGTENQGVDYMGFYQTNAVELMAQFHYTAESPL